MELEKIVILIIGFMGGLISKIVYDIYEIKKSGFIDEKELDKKIYKKIIKDLLPSNGSILLMKNHHFYDTYKFEVVSDLFNISDNYINHLEIIFFDKKLEKQKNKLFKIIKNFVVYISGETYPNKIGYELPRELLTQDRKEYESKVAKIHNFTTEIWKEYCIFINLGRKKFKI